MLEMVLRGIGGGIGGALTVAVLYLGWLIATRASKNARRRYRFCFRCGDEYAEFKRDEYDPYTGKQEVQFGCVKHWPTDR